MWVYEHGGVGVSGGGVVLFLDHYIVGIPLMRDVGMCFDTRAPVPSAFPSITSKPTVVLMCAVLTSFVTAGGSLLQQLFTALITGGLAADSFVIDKDYAPVLRLIVIAAIVIVIYAVFYALSAWLGYAACQWCAWWCHLG